MKCVHFYLAGCILQKIIKCVSMCEKCKTAQYGSASRANCCKLIRDQEKTFKRWPFWHQVEKMERNHCHFSSITVLLHPPAHIQNHCFPSYQIPVNDLKLPITCQTLASIAAPYLVLNYMNYAFWLRAGSSRQRLYGTWSHPRYYKDGINIELI